jgi:hypothetical protein
METLIDELQIETEHLKRISILYDYLDPLVESESYDEIDKLLHELIEHPALDFKDYVTILTFLNSSKDNLLNWLFFVHAAHNKATQERVLNSKQIKTIMRGF